MEFFVGMALMELLVPAVMILAGWFMWKHTPGKINHWAGYRTERSMKNGDTWKFANEYCGRLWWKLGWAILLPSVLPVLLCLDSGEKTVGTVAVTVLMIQPGFLIAGIFLTEKALKETFDRDGNRK